MKTKIVQKQKVIVVAGTTSSGKSDLAVRLAKEFDGEVISADSRQVYRDLDIGTGKITKKEMRSVPHYLLDVASPRRAFTASQFKKKGKQALKQLEKREKLPIIAGGTGFYIDALLSNSTLPEVPPNQKLRTQLEKKSPEELFAKLTKLDPHRAEKIDKHNPRRLIRAIEIASALGRVPPVSKKNKYETYDILWIGLELNKEKLKDKIDRRNEKMFQLGLVAEVKALREKHITWKRINELGFEYKFVADFVRGKMSKEEALQKMNKKTWMYAKQQISWFKRNKNIQWFDPKEIKKIEKVVENFIAN